MRIRLAYGHGHLDVQFPAGRTTVIEPSDVPGLPDERAAMLAALEYPAAAEPLRAWIKPHSKVCIVFTDSTRATPNERIIPWLLDHLAPLVPREQITLLNSTGTHRANTKAELENLLTPEVVANYRVLNHDCHANGELLPFGTTHDGAPALINRHCATADVRIITGFIEPHFFAGFSGGPKGIMPGVAGLATVMSNHGAAHIGDPRATFGVTRGNPIWEEMRDIALRVGRSFLLNVTLNHARQITGIFAGDLIEAHRAGCEFVRRSAMQRVKEPFDIVVTTNSGHPLDQNLYQGVKGMSAGARILKPGGLLLLACECSDGVPDRSPYDQLLRSGGNPEEILARLLTPGFVRPEQWQAQIQALVQRTARVELFSALPEDVVRACHLTPCENVAARIETELARLGPEARVAVLPQGPLTIPYLA